MGCDIITIYYTIQGYVSGPPYHGVPPNYAGHHHGQQQYAAAYHHHPMQHQQQHWQQQQPQQPNGDLCMFTRIVQVINTSPCVHACVCC